MKRNTNIYGLEGGHLNGLWDIKHFHFFPYKRLREQIWHWPKIGQGHPRIIILTNYDGPLPPILHTKFHENRSTGSWGEDFKGFLPNMGMVASLVMWPGGDPTNKFCSSIPWRLHMKFDFNRPSGFEDVWECWRQTTDRQQTPPALPSYSLWLRGAKKEKILKAYLCGRSRPHQDGFPHFKLTALKWFAALLPTWNSHK